MESDNFLNFYVLARAYLDDMVSDQFFCKTSMKPYVESRETIRETLPFFTHYGYLETILQKIYNFLNFSYMLAH